MQFKSMILYNVELSPGCWRMRLTAPQEFAAAKAGQFVMVRVSDSIDPLLRRPFGIFDVGVYTPTHGGAVAQPCFDMVYRVVGKGTEMLSALRENGVVDILGPLGNGFDLGDPDEEKLIVGGGVGLAPLYMLARELVARKSSVRLFAGGRSRNDVIGFGDFVRLGIECHAVTEDGSLGQQGLVTAALLKHLETRKGGEGRTVIYACGPHGMLNALANLAKDYGVTCHVSLENAMACGMGACLGCVTPGKGHSAETPDYRCVCSEGPVFESSDLKWER